MKNKRRKNILSKAKGFRFGRGTKKRGAKEAVTHAGMHAFAHRRRKKGDYRRIWQVRISAGLAEYELSYSKFIGLLNKKDIKLDRKILADLAENEPKAFEAVVKEVKS